MAIYPIDPTGLSAETTIPLSTIGAFRAMADATGGAALVNSNSFTQIFERIVRDNSTYYMLGFNSAYDKDDGKYVRLEVRARRPGLTVRTRGGYVAPTRNERRARERARDRETPPASAASAALSSPIATDGLPLRVTATPFKGRGTKARVAMVLELAASVLEFTRDRDRLVSRFDVSYVATDAKRRIYPEVRHPVTVTVESDAPERVSLEAARVRVVADLELEPGRYQLRVAAATATRNGSVVYDLEVPDFGDEPLALSGLALVVPSEPRVLTLTTDRPGQAMAGARCYSERCAGPAGAAAPLGAANADGRILDGRLPGAPTAVREFGREETVVLAAEVYDRARVRRDAPHAIAVTALLRSREGEVRPLDTAEEPATARRGDTGGHMFTLRLPLQDVPAGAYALRLEARSTADAGRVVVREIPIRVR